MDTKKKLYELIDYKKEMDFYHQCTIFHLMAIVESKWINLDTYASHIDELYNLYIKEKTNGCVS